jgi:DNA-binding CsgD family transcriptional regulator
MTNKEIGEILFITEPTARTHVGNILSKLGVNSRTEAAALAVEHGLV